DTKKIEAKIRSATKAIMPVHLFGQPADMDEINKIAKAHELIVVEDACQAFGATYKGNAAGSLANAACFSFFPTKNLGTMGDGGMSTTSDTKLADKRRTGRVHGGNRKDCHDRSGYTSQLGERH